MKYNRFFVKITLALVCAGIYFSGCEKGPELSVSYPEDFIFDASPVDTFSIHISSNINWTATVTKGEEWLSVTPSSGKGNATIKLIADENDEFVERIALLAISGDGVKTDTIRIAQAPSIDVAEMIEDKIFKQYCLYLFDASEDGKISLKEARSTQNKLIENNVIVYRYRILVKDMGIESLVGIEYFTNIRELNCESNELKALDVSKNKELRTLNCSYNSDISELNVSELTKLITLKSFNTNLQNIDVTNNSALLELWVSNNSIQSINVSNNPELDLLNCSYNLLTSLDVTKNPKLSNLYCTNNDLSTLNLSNNPYLVNLYCNDNKFSTLDLRNNKVLQRLYCTQNRITSLDLSNNTELLDLRCDINQLTALDITHNTKLRDFKCTSNQIKGTLDISKNTDLLFINVKNNPELNVINVWRGFDMLSPYYEKDEHVRWEVK